jgi:NTP pyrophosphatase (non-canonical NTP hydrolase)|tara:strand:+ start:184 stop:558 length:375 start_codon:yes stop_codon:yes gene_type:complete
VSADGASADEVVTSEGDGSLTLKDAQARVDSWISQFEEGYWPPLTNLARLIEEVGELAREMNHQFGHKTKKADEPDQNLAIELADVLFVLLVIANEQGIELDSALEQVLEKYRVRDSDRWAPKV